MDLDVTTRPDGIDLPEDLTRYHECAELNAPFDDARTAVRVATSSSSSAVRVATSSAPAGNPGTGIVSASLRFPP